MKNFLMSAMALTAVIVMPGAAFADDVADRREAIRLCRAEVSAQAGVDARELRLDQVRTRGRSVRVDLDLWRNGRLQNIRCDVDRTEEQLTVAAVSPTLQTAAAQ